MVAVMVDSWRSRRTLSSICPKFTFNEVAHTSMYQRKQTSEAGLEVLIVAPSWKMSPLNARFLLSSPRDSAPTASLMIILYCRWLAEPGARERGKLTWETEGSAGEYSKQGAQ